MEALRQLKAAEPPSFLSPSQDLSQKERAASQYLFSALKPYSSSCELLELVTDGFDAEQIWAQIEAQREELVRLVKTQLRKLEKSLEELEKQFSFGGERVAREKEEVGGFEDGVIEESDGDDVEKEEEEGSEEEEEEEGSEEEEGEEEEGDGLRDVEDEFFKIKDLERFVEGEEEREFGNMGKGKGKKGEEKKRKRRAVEEEEDEDSEDDEEEEDEDEDEDEDDDEDDDEVWNLVSFELITLID